MLTAKVDRLRLTAKAQPLGFVQPGWMQLQQNPSVEGQRGSPAFHDMARSTNRLRQPKEQKPGTARPASKKKPWALRPLKPDPTQRDLVHRRLHGLRRDCEPRRVAPVQHHVMIPAG